MNARQQVLILRIVLAFLAACAVTAQTLIIPTVASSYAARYPEVAELAPLYGALLIGTLVACEVGLLATWMLANGALKRKITDGVYKPWSVVLLVAGLIAGMLLTLLFSHALFIATLGGPPMLFGFAGSVLFTSLWFLGCRQIIVFIEEDIQHSTPAHLRPASAS